jgi:hypothetical protein
MIERIWLLIESYAPYLATLAVFGGLAIVAWKPDELGSYLWLGGLIVLGLALNGHRLGLGQDQSDKQATADRPLVLGPPRSTAEEIEHLADLHSRGVLDDGEFRRAKQRLLGSSDPADPR